ncbi:MAG TPA: ABC transporter substrate-binding protein [Jiangellaceae bacterium]
MGGSSASFGYWVRRRRLALDLTRDALARRVGCSPSAVKKIERDERRPSRTMANRLAEALGLPPDQRGRFVAAALGESPPERLARMEPDHELGPAPPWLVRSPSAEIDRVVGRDSELTWLQSHLSAVLGGRSRVVFVVGEAGVGKTALLRAFADRASCEVPDLVVARGAGTAVGALGDPYFPIRDAFRMLVAGRHAPLQADQLTRRQAQRLWEFSAVVAETIVESGPRLLDVLVPVETISERLGMTVPAPAPTDASRMKLADEITMVLRALAERRPLLLVLDDMQWSDTASAELLFHLVRTLADAQILMVCAYRGSEVADSPGAAQGVLRKATLESSREIGDALLDLDDTDPAAERTLCDALLDMEAPNLDESIHEEFYRRTRGYPLLVLELARELKARGDLVRSEGTSWAARPGVSWDHVPARVAAVIEQRLDRLDADERALLTAAAVEGEYFTAEVAAHVAEVEVRNAHRVLSERLDRVHGLVHEDSVGRSGGRPVTRYRFGHAVFHSLVYDRLSEGTRAHAHGLVAAELEALYSDNLEPVIPLLAHHFAEAGDADKAVLYLIQTGDRARLLQARDEALAAYGRAVELLREQGDTERLARSLMRIGLTHQTAFDHESAQRAFDEAFALWQTADDSSTADTAGSATLRLASKEPESLDPLLSGGLPPIIPVLFSRLVRYDEGANVVPDVAERWEISTDGRRYTFRLRGDVVWTDGQPVTAHDFVINYRRALDPTAKVELAPKLLSPVVGVEDVLEGAIPPEHAGFHATDDRTLVIELAEPTSYFLYNLTNEVLAPVPGHLLQVHGRDWCRPDTIVSNGPFQLVAWEQGVSLTLERNPNYHGSVRGNVQRLSVTLTKPWDEGHELLYQADEVDILATSFGTRVEVIDRLRLRFPHEYETRADSTRTLFYWLDHTVPPLDDRRVRQAMALAVDRESCAKRWPVSVAAHGSFVPPGIPGHVADLASYDPVHAARLIADLVRVVSPVTVIGAQFVEPIVKQLAHDWRAVGLAVETRLCATFADQDQAWRETAGPKVGVVGWIADYPDPDTYLRVAVEEKLPHWKHGRYAALLREATRTNNVGARLELYQAAEHVLADEAVLVPLLYWGEHLMIKPWVAKFPSLPGVHPGLKDVIIGPRGNVR